MDELEKKKYYADEYRIHMFGQANPPKIDLDIQQRRAEHLGKFIEATLGSLRNWNHLDIGSGSGALLNFFQEVMGTKSKGVEPDNKYRDYSKERGLEVYSSLQEYLENNQVQPDIVTLSHVLEHLDDPASFLNHLRSSVLNPTGYLLIEVPNLFFHEYFELAHVFAFSKDSLTNLLFESGFEVINSKIHGFPGHFTPRYITLIATIQSNPGTIIIIPPKCKKIRVTRLFGIALSRFEDFLRKVSRVPKKFSRRFLKKKLRN